jgi:hypothetical protein
MFIAHAESKHRVKLAREHEAANAMPGQADTTNAAARNNLTVLFMFSLALNYNKKTILIKEKC